MRKGIGVMTVVGALSIGWTAFTVPAADAGPVNVDIRLTGYLPAPPGVHIYFEAGRPYYIENHRRVYIEKEPKGDRGRHEGHYKDKHHGKKNGHGKGH